MVRIHLPPGRSHQRTCGSAPVGDPRRFHMSHRCRIVRPSFEFRHVGSGTAEAISLLLAFAAAVALANPLLNCLGLALCGVVARFNQDRKGTEWLRTS